MAFYSMNKIFCRYDMDGPAHIAKIYPEQDNVIFAIEIENYNTAANFEDLIVTIWADDISIKPYQFNFDEMVHNPQLPGRAVFIMPLDHSDIKPPFTLSLFCEDKSVDMSSWQVVIIWDRLLKE